MRSEGGGKVEGWWGGSKSEWKVEGSTPGQALKPNRLTRCYSRDAFSAAEPSASTAAINSR